MADEVRRKGDAALLLALAGGQTLRDAALAAGVSEKTAARRWADPDFRQRVAELRGEMVNQAMGRMADGMTEAATVLRTLLAAQSESIRLSAARALLEMTIKIRDSVEYEARLKAIETRLAKKGNAT